MSHSVVCYQQPDKAKSQHVMRAFAAGCGGKLASTEALELEAGAAAFYGVRPGWLRLWEQVKREGRDFYYADNSYFDVSRETYFRITRNALQCDGRSTARCLDDGAARLKAMGIKVYGWQCNGGHVVVCPQTNEFLQVVAGYKGDWLDDAIATLRKHTDRPVRIRKKGCTRPLAEDLRGAWALVTHMSCAAVEALIAGVPVFCTGESAAQSMGLSDLSKIESPRYPEGRQAWAEWLAASQWNLNELHDGTCWRALSGR